MGNGKSSTGWLTGVPVRVKTGYREGKNGWGKDETAHYGCDPATYHGYVRAVAAYSASHMTVTPEATERAATRVVTPSWGVSKGKGDISALLEAAKACPLPTNEGLTADAGWPMVRTWHQSGLSSNGFRRRTQRSSCAAHWHRSPTCTGANWPTACATRLG